MPRQKRERRTQAGRRKSVAEEGRKMVTTTIAVDEEMHRRLRHLAIDEKKSLRDLIREALAELLANRGGK